MSQAAVREAESAPPPLSAGGAPELDEERPLGMDLPRRTKVLVLLGSMLAMFIASLEQSVVNPALPQIVAELGGLNLYPWLIQAFLIAQIAVIPIAGALSDVVGRKPLLLTGVLLFLGGTAGCGAAGGIYELIAFRALQGAGAGVIMTSTFSVMGDLFPASERGKYIGLFAGIFALSGVIGAPLGGVLTEAISWRWVFWIMFFVGPIAGLVIALKMPWLRPPRRPLRFDWLGTALLLPMLMPGLISVSFGGELGWTNPLVLALFGVSALSTLLFVAVERRAAVPIVPNPPLRHQHHCRRHHRDVRDRHRHDGRDGLHAVLPAGRAGRQRGRSRLGDDADDRDLRRHGDRGRPDHVAHRALQVPGRAGQPADGRRDGPAQHDDPRDDDPRRAAADRPLRHRHGADDARALAGHAERRAAALPRPRLKLLAVLPADRRRDRRGRDRRAVQRAAGLGPAILAARRPGRPHLAGEAGRP